jgi:hypothetical protein
MDKVKLNSSDGPFQHYIFLKCPQCSNLIVVSGSSLISVDIEELKRNNFAARCKHCTFNGVVVGSEVVHSIEFDATEFRRSAASR